MTTMNVANNVDLTKALKAAKANDIIKVGEGVVLTETFFPDMQFDPKTPVVITSVSDKNQGIFRGICLQSDYKGNFEALGKGGGSKFRGLVFDTITLEANKLSKIKLPSGDSVTLKKPVGWRLGQGESTGMFGIRIGSGCRDIVIRNVLADGFANQFSLAAGCQGITMEHVDCMRGCEDHIKVWGGKSLAFRYIRQGEFAGVDYDEAVKAFGMTPNAAKVPPHADFFQSAGGVAGLIIYGLYMNDDTCRVHGILLNDSTKSGKQVYSDVSISTCWFDMTHTSAFVGGNANNFEFIHNKVVRLRVVPDAPTGKNDTKITFGNLTGKVNITDNVCRKINTGKVTVGTVGNNTISNDPNVKPKNYTEIRPGNKPPVAGRELGTIKPDPVPTPDPEPEEPDVDVVDPIEEDDVKVMKISGLYVTSVELEEDGTVSVEYK